MLGGLFTLSLISFYFSFLFFVRFGVLEGPSNQLKNESANPQTQHPHWIYYKIYHENELQCSILKKKKKKSL